MEGPLEETWIYCQTSNKDTWADNEIVDHSDVVGASPRCSCRRCSNYIFMLDLTPDFNVLEKDNCKTRWESFKFWNFVHLILEILQYVASVASGDALTQLCE